MIGVYLQVNVKVNIPKILNLKLFYIFINFIYSEPFPFPIATVVPPTTEGSCTNGKVFSSCGTLCPLTCENRGNPEPCGLLCAPGCHCPNDLFELGDGCVDVSDCPCKLVFTSSWHY